MAEIPGKSRLEDLGREALGIQDGYYCEEERFLKECRE